MESFDDEADRFSNETCLISRPTGTLPVTLNNSNLSFVQLSTQQLWLQKILY